MATSPLPNTSKRGTKSQVAHKWADWLHSSCHLRAPQRYRAGDKIKSGPQVGRLALLPLPSAGSPTPPSRGPNQSGGKNHKWPTSEQSGYVTPAVSGIPTASERGGESQVAHKWAKWLRHPCRLGDPHRFRAGGGDHKWPTSGQSGYVTPAVSGIPTASERGGGGIRSGPLVGKVAMPPLPSRGSPPLQSGGGGGITSGPQVGKVATSPLPSRGSPPLQSGRQNQKWPTCGQSGYVTPTVSGIPTASERGGGGGIRSGPLAGKVAMPPLPSRGSPPLQSGGGKSEVAHLWARWLRHPCHLGDRHRCRASVKVR